MYEARMRTLGILYEISNLKDKPLHPKVALKAIRSTSIVYRPDAIEAVPQKVRRGREPYHHPDLTGVYHL